MIEEFCAALNARIVSDRYAIDIDLLIEVEDDGPGIAHPENLFVPFFTTKAGGQWNRPGPRTPDCGGARWQPAVDQSAGLPRCDGHRATAVEQDTGRRLNESSEWTFRARSYAITLVYYRNSIVPFGSNGSRKSTAIGASFPAFAIPVGA